MDEQEIKCYSKCGFCKYVALVLFIISVILLIVKLILMVLHIW